MDAKGLALWGIKETRPDSANPHPDHVHTPAQKDGRKRADLSYCFVVRANLWLIAGGVSAGLAIWWTLT